MQQESRWWARPKEESWSQGDSRLVAGTVPLSAGLLFPAAQWLGGSDSSEGQGIALPSESSDWIQRALEAHSPEPGPLEPGHQVAASDDLVYVVPNCAAGDCSLLTGTAAPPTSWTKLLLVPGLPSHRGRCSRGQVAVAGALVAKLPWQALPWPSCRGRRSRGQQGLCSRCPAP